jgi:alpha-amylase
VERASGAIVEIAERGRPFDFACVIARRREVYHARVEEAARRAAQDERAGSDGGGGHAAKPATIHGAISMKEPGLERLLEYDERPRVASQEWILPAGQLAAAGGSLSAAIGRGPAGLRFKAAASSGAAAPLITLLPSGGPFPGIRKEISTGPDECEFDVGFTGLPAEHWLITEWNLSLLTPDAPGRRLLIGGAIPRGAAPGSTGEADSATSIRLEDSEYLRAALTLEFHPAARVEWFPIETVSLSEAGAERVYQGTAFVIGFHATASGAPVRIHARIEGAAGAL